MIPAISAIFTEKLDPLIADLLPPNFKLILPYGLNIHQKRFEFQQPSKKETKKSRGTQTDDSLLLLYIQQRLVESSRILLREKLAKLQQHAFLQGPHGAALLAGLGGALGGAGGVLGGAGGAAALGAGGGPLEGAGGVGAGLGGMGAAGSGAPGPSVRFAGEQVPNLAGMMGAPGGWEGGFGGGMGGNKAEAGMMGGGRQHGGMMGGPGMGGEHFMGGSSSGMHPGSMGGGPSYVAPPAWAA